MLGFVPEDGKGKEYLLTLPSVIPKLSSCVIISLKLIVHTIASKSIVYTIALKLIVTAITSESMLTLFHMVVTLEMPTATLELMPKSSHAITPALTPARIGAKVVLRQHHSGIDTRIGANIVP
jgi:hypothetical protein